MGNVSVLVKAIDDDFQRRHPQYHNNVKAWLPEDAAVLLAADRFYGTAAPIGYCQQARWSYRIRLKGNLTLHHEGGELTTGEVRHGFPKA